MNATSKTNSISRGAFLRKVLVGASLAPAASLLAQTNGSSAKPELPDSGNLRAFVELARSDIRTQKAIIIAQNMPLTEDEAVVFWPLQREYETALGKLLDERYANLKQFVQTYETMTNSQASELATRSFELEALRSALKRTYFKRFKKVIPATKAARFFQIENQLNMTLDLQLAAAMPLIK